MPLLLVPLQTLASILGHLSGPELRHLLGFRPLVKSKDRELSPAHELTQWNDVARSAGRDAAPGLGWCRAVRRRDEAGDRDLDLRPVTLEHLDEHAVATETLAAAATSSIVTLRMPAMEPV